MMGSVGAITTNVLHWEASRTQRCTFIKADASAAASAAVELTEALGGEGASAARAASDIGVPSDRLRKVGAGGKGAGRGCKGQRREVEGHRLKTKDNTKGRAKDAAASHLDKKRRVSKHATYRRYHKQKGIFYVHVREHSIRMPSELCAILATPKERTHTLFPPRRRDLGIRRLSAAQHNTNHSTNNKVKRTARQKSWTGRQQARKAVAGKEGYTIPPPTTRALPKSGAIGAEGNSIIPHPLTHHCLTVGPSRQNRHRQRNMQTRAVAFVNTTQAPIFLLRSCHASAQTHLVSLSRKQRFRPRGHRQSQKKRHSLLLPPRRPKGHRPATGLGSPLPQPPPTRKRCPPKGRAVTSRRRRRGQPPQVHRGTATALSPGAL